MNQRTEHGTLTRLAQGVLLLLLLLAPLFRSGKTPLAALLLELLALAALVVLCWEPARLGRVLGRWEKVFLVTLVALPLLQLVPLPFSRLALPGQADYYTVQELVGGQGWSTLSLLPRESWTGLLILLVPVAVFLLGRVLHRDQLTRLMHLVLAMAALQAVLGLLQFGTGPGSVFYLGMEGVSSAVGTYTSRNNYVGFMYCAFMVSLALFMATLGTHRQRAGKETLRQKLIYLSTGQGHRAFLYGALAVLFLLAVIFTRSRAGISVTILGVVLAAFAYSRRIGGDNVYGLTGTVVSGVVALAVAIGLAPVLDRFAQLDAVENGRVVIFEGTIKGITQFFPFGAGAGTFRDTFPPFQDLSFASKTVNRAHNSYLEWLFDGGLLAAVLIVLGLVLFALRWRVVYKAGAWGEFRFLQVGAGLGMVLMLLHDNVDYNLFVPANMVYFAFLAAVFFHPYQEPVRQRKSKRSHTDSARQRVPLRPVPDEPQSNPFLDPPDDGGDGNTAPA